ncbi:MAG: YidC/Oxa1 family membrane protein insertase [Clostridia bacterium]|nr:YidC/Oxa1 family membrane protein insertase [Clostridia bacterium]
MGFISELFGYVLNALYNLFTNYGIAIIIFSVLLRIILIPITIKQQKTMKKSNKMQEEMKQIQFKYKNNPEKLNQETMDLYKREKFNPFSGCLSAILQLVIILAVFWLVSQPLTYMKKVQNSEIYNEYKTKIEESSNTKSSYKEIAIINAVESDYKQIEEQLKQENIENREELEHKKAKLEELRLNMEFLGIDLSKVPTQSLQDFRVYIIPVLYVITSFISIRMTTKIQTSKKENEEKSEEMQSMEQMNKSMSYMMPIMSISIAVIAPLGLALYWLVSNILMILERIIINKIMSSKEEKENV